VELIVRSSAALRRHSGSAGAELLLTITEPVASRPPGEPSADVRHQRADWTPRRAPGVSPCAA